MLRGTEAKTALAQSQFEQIDKRTVQYIEGIWSNKMRNQIPMLPRLGPLVQFTSPPQSLVKTAPVLSAYEAKQAVTMHPRPLHESNTRSKIETCKEPSSNVAAAEAIYAPRTKPTKPSVRRERRLASRGEEEEEAEGAERDFPPCD